MAKGKSGWKNLLDPILRYAIHEIAIYFWVKGAKWMLEEKLNLPHLSEEESDDELQKVAGTKISTKEILEGFQEKQGWSDEDYSMKALRQIYDKLNNILTNRPFRNE